MLSLTLNVVGKKYNIPFILYDILTYDFNKLYPIPSTNHILISSDILRRINNNKNDKNHNNNNNNINYGGHNDRNFGGALIFGSNSILHFGQTIDYGLSLNKHGDILSKDYPLLRKWTERVINLENCNLTLLKNNNNNNHNMNRDKNKEKSMDFILSDGDGFMYILSISSGKMNLCTMGMGPIPSTMITITNRLNHFIFIGSRLADSLLICHQIRETKKKEIILPKEQKNKQEIISTQNDLAMSLFGNNKNNDDNDKNEKENKNSRKRSYSEMDIDGGNGGDLAMSLFGVTTETLEAAINNDILMEKQNQKTPSSKEVSLSIEQNDSNNNNNNNNDNVPSRHLTLFGPKVKRRKLSTNKELQINDLNFINVIDFNEEKLFELEIEKERASRPTNDEFDEENNNKQNEQENEIQIKQNRKNEEILRKKYKFKLHDIMTNLSPITSVIMSKSYDTRYLHGDYINMMASTGYGTQSKLSIVHEGIRPQILAKTNSNKLLSNVVDCWTLFQQKQDKYHKYHKYLVVTNLYKTQILDIEDKIKIIHKSDFNINSRTIICHHIKQSYIVQVHLNGVRLLNDLKLIYQYNLDNNNINIIDAHICDEYILIHLSDKTIRLLIFDKNTKKFKVSIPNLSRYKIIDEKEKDRRKKEFVSRRCNRMTWQQYKKLESSINEFLSVDIEQNTKNINGLIRYIDETLINPSIKQEKEEKKEEKNNNNNNESDDEEEEEDDIQLADHLKQKQISSTGWQNSDWTKKQKKKKTLFNLNLSIQVILRRLYGKQINDSFYKSPNQVLQDMITKDLDIGDIEKTYLYKYGGIKNKYIKKFK